MGQCLKSLINWSIFLVSLRHYAFVRENAKKGPGVFSRIGLLVLHQDEYMDLNTDRIERLAIVFEWGI